MEDRQFRETVIGDLREIKEGLKNFRAQVDGHHKTLYGEEGRGGLVADMVRINQNQKTWSRILLGIQGVVIAIFTWLVGFKMKGGN